MNPGVKQEKNADCWFVYFFSFPPLIFFNQTPIYKCGQTPRHHRRELHSKQKLWQNLPCQNKPPTPPCFGIWGNERSNCVNSAATIAAHEGVTAHRVLHLNERQRPHRDFARALDLEAGFLVERHEKILTHEHGTANVRQTAQVLQVAPHQDGTAALLPERTVHRQHVDVHRGTVRFVKGQSFLYGTGDKRG